MESTTENDVKGDEKQYLTSYYRKYYLANREKLLARSKQRYAERVKTKDDLLSKSNQTEGEDKEEKKVEEIFVIDDISVPNKTTIEKLKELFSSDAAKII